MRGQARHSKTETNSVTFSVSVPCLSLGTFKHALPWLLQKQEALVGISQDILPQGGIITVASVPARDKKARNFPTFYLAGTGWGWVQTMAWIPPGGLWTGQPKRLVALLFLFACCCNFHLSSFSPSIHLHFSFFQKNRNFPFSLYMAWWRRDRQWRDRQAADMAWQQTFCTTVWLDRHEKDRLGVTGSRQVRAWRHMKSLKKAGLVGGADCLEPLDALRPPTSSCCLPSPPPSPSSLLLDRHAQEQGASRTLPRLLSSPPTSSPSLPFLNGDRQGDMAATTRRRRHVSDDKTTDGERRRRRRALSTTDRQTNKAIHQSISVPPLYLSSFCLSPSIHQRDDVDRERYSVRVSLAWRCGFMAWRGAGVALRRARHCGALCALRARARACGMHMRACARARAL